MATTAVLDRERKRERKTEQRQAKAEGGLKGKLAAARERLESYAVGRVAMSTVEGFLKDKVPNHAAAMTYYGIFSLFPLLLLFMSLAGLALQSNQEARQQIMSLIVGLLPQGQDELRKLIQTVIDAKGAAAGIGIVFLLWSALSWFQVIDDNINQIWGVSKGRSFIKGKLFALLIVAAVGGVAVVSFGATAAIAILKNFTNAIPGSALGWQALVTLVSFLAIAAVFFVLYRYAPQRKVYFADIWPAALLTALVWEATRRLLTVYIERTNMVSGYGPIGAAMLLLFWLYIVSMIILIGAELAYAIAKERRHIEPDAEMQVIAEPGEQPTPKFAPQVGSGATSEAAAAARGPVTAPAAGQPARGAGQGTAGTSARGKAHASAPAVTAVAPPAQHGAGSYVVRGMGLLVGAVVSVALLARRQMNGRA